MKNKLFTLLISIAFISSSFYSFKQIDVITHVQESNSLTLFSSSSSTEEPEDPPIIPPTSYSS